VAEEVGTVMGLQCILKIRNPIPGSPSGTVGQGQYSINSSAINFSGLTRHVSPMVWAQGTEAFPFQTPGHLVTIYSLESLAIIVY
jgi:hypothetical protein